MRDTDKAPRDLLERAQFWPESARSKFDSSRGIEKGLRAAAKGNFATNEQIEAVFAKYRPE